MLESNIFEITNWTLWFPTLIILISLSSSPLHWIFSLFDQFSFLKGTAISIPHHCILHVFSFFSLSVSWDWSLIRLIIKLHLILSFLTLLQSLLLHYLFIFPPQQIVHLISSLLTLWLVCSHMLISLQAPFFIDIFNTIIVTLSVGCLVIGKIKLFSFIVIVFIGLLPLQKPRHCLSLSISFVNI